MEEKNNKIFTEEEWSKLTAIDPTYSKFQSSSQWQGGYANAQTFFADDPLAEIIGSAAKDGKGRSQNWRQLQKKCWELYRTFANISAATNSKADYTAGYGFSVYSENTEINSYFHDLVYSYRNRMYASLIGWTVRMLAEGELFLLLIFDEEGRATIRVLEPERIGKGVSDDGLITNPDDVTQTLFYKHYYTKQEFELIPDISIAFNPDLEKLAKDVKGFDAQKTKRSRGKGKFSKVGGYYRFALQWKNLTGIFEYKRDLSVISTVLEAINLYWNAIKWQLDHKKAQCAYTNVIGFEDSPQGRIAFSIWSGLTDTERAATGLTESQTPGSTVILIPGMTFEVKAPQLSRLDGENRDLLNVAGAGMKSPQDLFQGQSSGSTHASLRASRSPLEMEIKNMQYKTGNFLKYELFRACTYISSSISATNTVQLEYDKEVVSEYMGGSAKFETIKVEPIELLEFAFPEISFDSEMEGKASAYLGSKHAGLRSIGVSDKKIAIDLGVPNLGKQIAEKALEERKYGIRDSSIDTGAKDQGNTSKDNNSKVENKNKKDNKSKEGNING